jgi:hypothetical protein
MTTGVLAPSGIQKFFDNNGNPLALGLVYTYQAGTSTPVATYTDSTLGTPNANPIVLNFRGEAPIWLVPGQAYKFNVTDAAGNQIPGWPVDQILGGFSVSSNIVPSANNTYSLGTPSFSWSNLYLGPNDAPAFDVTTGDIAYYERTPAEITASVTPTSKVHAPFPVYDMARYGIQPNGVDNTAIVQAVFNMLKVTGGTMKFPYGDWAFYLDVSGSYTPPIIVEGQGSNFRCFTAAPTQSAVMFGNNSGAAVVSAGTPNVPVSFGGASLEFRNCNFVAQKFSGGAVTGDLNTAVAFYGFQAKFWNCSFAFGKIASFYGCYTQYSEFWSCGFYQANFATTSAGCILTGHGNSSGSNEVVFMRCYMQLNAIALWIQGAIQVRAYGCNFQGNGTQYPYGVGAASLGVILLDADSSGFGCINPEIDGCWFEVNYAPHIWEVLSSGARISRCVFFGGAPYVCTIQTTFCNDLAFLDNFVYSANMVMTINYPNANPGTASISVQGGNFVPTTLNIIHPGPSYVDIQSASARTRQNDNVLYNNPQQVGANSMPLVQTEQYGFKSAVARTVSTSLFQIAMENLLANPAQTSIPLIIELYAWQDTQPNTAYGYCGRVQRFYAYINNNSGTLAVAISAAIDGQDLGVNTAFQAIGVLALTAAVAGSVAANTGTVTFSASFPGAGTNAAGVTQATIGYTVRAMGGNTFTVKRQ